MTDELRVERLDAPGAAAALPGLGALLADAVASGASVGFLPPLAPEDARAYWEDVVASLRDGGRVLLAARSGGELVGSVQLILEPRANGGHRAEVAKLLVHSSRRRRGIGRRLMEALEREAAREGRTTLVLDTRQGDPSEALYRGMGYQVAGTIPRYARSADGSLHATVFMYKLLPLGENRP